MTFAASRADRGRAARAGGAAVRVHADVGSRSLLINGVVDVHADEGARTLIVDWKSDALGERDPETLTAGGYSTQRTIYALAALRAGAERVEKVVHCYLERPDEPAVAVYEATDTEALERELLARWRTAWWRAASSPPEAAFRAMCGLSGPGGAVRARIGAHIESFRRDPVLMWRPCHCVSSSRRKRSGS